MKKVLIVLILLAVSILPTGCTQLNTDSAALKSNYYSLGHDTFNSNYSRALASFGEIVKAASDAKNDNDVAYLNGRIDEYLNRGITCYSNIRHMDKFYLDKIIAPDIQTSVLDLPGDLSLYLEKLQTEVLKKNDLEKLKKMKNDFISLYELERSLNNDLYRSNEEANQYQDSIQKIEQIIKSTN